MAEIQEQLSFGEGTVLRINAGHELALLGKQPVTDNEQLMYPAYRAALDALNGILASSREWVRHNCLADAQYPKDQEYEAELDELYAYSNNIIAFCGARGQGKTSAMLSFSHALPTTRKKEDSGKGFSSADVGNACFFVLPPIDPTMLGQNELALELILARLLDEINEKWRNPVRGKSYTAYPYTDEDNKHKILECFNTCMAGLRSEAKPEATGAEKLARAKDAFRVKEALWRIVRYFIYLLGHELQNGYLVVQLDDTDMQFECAFSIMEEVRKYLSIPNIIVLMATDLEQLRALVALHNSEALRRKPSDPEVSRLATKYLDKLIPASHAIHLPSVKGQSEKKKQLYLQVFKDTDSKKKTDANPNTREDNSLEWRLFKLIYEKTGLVFIGHESYLHEIIPTTLRGVVQLYRMLDRMPSTETFGGMRKLLKNEENDVLVYFKKRAEIDRIKLNNLSLFEDYFISDWVPSKLVPKYQAAFQTIQKSQDNRRIDIAIRYFRENASGSEKDNLLKAVSRDEDVKNSFYFIFRTAEERDGFVLSKGDFNNSGEESPGGVTAGNANGTKHRLPYLRLLCALDEMRKDTDDDYRFVFALRTYFSILFSKAALMDEMDSIEKLKTLDFIKDIWAPLRYQHLLEMLTGTVSNLEQKDLLNPNMDEIGHNVVTSLSEMYEFAKGGNLDKRQYDHLVRTLLSSVITTLWEYSNAQLPPQRDIESLWSQYTYLIEMLLYICCNWDVQHQLFNIVFLNVKERALRRARTPAEEKDKENAESQIETDQKKATDFWELFELSLGIGSERQQKTIKSKRAVGMPDALDNKDGDKRTFLEVLNEMAVFVRIAPERDT